MGVEDLDFADIELLAFDIDGTLTDATTWWGGQERGWLQRYSVRDGESLLRLRAAGVVVVPLSRNKTDAARQRMKGLKMETRWVGVSDKLAAVDEIAAEYGIAPQKMCYVGDGAEDGHVFERVGLGCAVADAHPDALERADVVLDAAGGQRAIEEIELRRAGRWGTR